MTGDPTEPSRDHFDRVLATAVDLEYLAAGVHGANDASFAALGLSPVELDWIAVALLVAFGVELAPSEVASRSPHSLYERVVATCRARAVENRSSASL